MTSRTGRVRSAGGRQVITDAATAASAELRSRQIRYNITMAFRTACFVGMIFTPDPFRWALFGGAVILPYVAMIAGSQADRRTHRQGVALGVDEPEPAGMRELDGPHDQPDRDRGAGHE